MYTAYTYTDPLYMCIHTPIYIYIYKYILRRTAIVGDPVLFLFVEDVGDSWYSICGFAIVRVTGGTASLSCV